MGAGPEDNDGNNEWPLSVKERTLVAARPDDALAPIAAMR
jgi:hypothetical protein